MKFSQLMEYTQNHTQNVMEKVVPDPFINNQN